MYTDVEKVEKTTNFVERVKKVQEEEGTGGRRYRRK